MQGSFFFAAQDIDASGCPAAILPAVILFDDINISGYTNLELRVYLAEDDALDGNEDWDASDYVHFDYDIDNSGTFQNGIWIESSGATNTTANIDTDWDGTGDGAVITPSFIQYTQNLTGTGNLLDIQITLSLDAGDEDIAFDYIEIWGTPSGPNIVVSPNSLTGFTYVEGSGPSGEQSFTVEGSNLTDNITVTSPANWEISTISGGPFQTTPITLTQSGGIVSLTTIYTRMVSGLTFAGSPYSGNIACASASDGITENVAVDGTVTDPNACATELIISEYIEGSSNNKYLELYNRTGNTINLADYEIRQYNNGSSTPTYTLVLSGTLADDAVYVIKNSSETLGVTADLSTASAVMTFNGDDALELFNTVTNQPADIIGQIGSDPGTEWGSGLTSTADNTLVRKTDVIIGDTNGTDAFDPALQWDGYSTDYISNLGTHTINCFCSEPTVDAGSLTFPVKTSTSIDLSWTSGDGTNRIVVCREGAAVSFAPADNNTYTADADYSAGAEVGTAGEGNKVVYNGNGNTPTVTGLTPGTIYYFKIYEYSCSGGAEDYYISGTPAEGNETTLPEDAGSFTLTCITNTTATLTWNLPAGGFDGILITARESTLPPSNPSCDGSTLVSPNTDFSAALTYCGNTTSSKYVYNATGTTVTITGLTAGADYVFKSFTYNGTDWTTGTQISGAAQISDVSNQGSSPQNNGATIYWVNPSTCYDEIMVVGHETGSVTQIPSGDGSAYTANSVFGLGTNLGTNDYVVYKGTQTNFDVTGLTNGIQYCFKIFVRKGSEWSLGAETCITPADVTYFNPGELVIIGFDSNVGGGNDSIFLATFVDIKPGTEFLYVNSRFEAGAPANVRTYEWHGGGDDPNADPGIFKISYSSTAASNIAAGSIISFSTTGYKADYIKVDGVLNTDFTSTNIVGSANIHATDGDQIWLLQGSFTDQGTYYTLDGNVLWGLTNNIDWVPIDQPVSDASDGTGRESRLNPDLECFNLSMPAGKGYALYLNSSDHNNSKRNLLLAVMNGANWADGTGDATMNFNADFTAPYNSAEIGMPFTITTGGNSDGTWLGGDTGYENDWFSCMNWEGLTVPDLSVNVTIPATINQPVIDHTSVKAPKYDYIAQCNDIIIDNNTLTIEGSVLDTLYINGNLIIQNSGILDMNSGGSNDGLIYISGNWDNLATFDAGKGTVVFNGANSQTITTSATSETFNNLRINNSNLLGVITNNNLLINDTLSQNNSLLNLNGKNIELKGVYENINSYFEGDASSDFVISADADNGNIDSIYFKNDINVNNFSIDRTGKSAVLMTDLFVNGNLSVISGNVTFTPGNNYDIAGSLINTPGTPDALIIKSDASGTASLIQNTGNIPATVERYLSGNNWHYIFTPLTQVDTATFTVAPWGDINPNILWYDETVADFWQGFTLYNPSGWTRVSEIPSQYFRTDRAYINYFTADKVYTQTGGVLNDADKTFTLSYTDNGTGAEPTTGTDWDNFEGWNLLGNPYVSAVDWDNIGLDKTYIENFIYYYDDTQDKYLCYGGNPPWDNSGVSINGGTQYIPAGQGFFVKALPTGNAQPFIMPKSARVHSAQAFYKTSVNQTNTIKLQIRKENYTDETIIRFFPDIAGTTEGHDYNLDAYKMFAWNSLKPQLYSYFEENTNLFAVNSLSDFSETKIVPLGVSIGEYGEYFLEMTENDLEGTHIWLEDRTNNVNTNLLKQSSYSFSQSVEKNNDRFYLHFEKNTAPVLNIDIPDQVSETDKLYEYTVSEDIFTDSNFEDELTLSATLENNNPLPDWLSFNSETQTFSGIPSEVQMLNIKVTATDIFGASTFDIFNLQIKNATDIFDFKEKTILIYPNPVTNILTVNLQNIKTPANIVIYNVSGNIVYKSVITESLHNIDLRNISSGIYLLEINIGGKKIRKKITKF